MQTEGGELAGGGKMALELNAITSSVNGSNSDSNDVTDGMAFETSNNHSSSRNDLEFLDDQQRWQRTISRSRGNIKHKPTYVSIFASDPDCSSPLFDKFDQRFSTRYLFQMLCDSRNDVSEFGQVQICYCLPS